MSNKGFLGILNGAIDNPDEVSYIEHPDNGCPTKWVPMMSEKTWETLKDHYSKHYKTQSNTMSNNYQKKPYWQNRLQMAKSWIHISKSPVFDEKRKFVGFTKGVTFKKPKQV